MVLLLHWDYYNLKLNYMDQQVLSDSILSAVTTATVHTGIIANQPVPANNSIITLLISIVSGIVAPILKSFLEKKHRQYKEKKRNKNVS